MCIRAKQGEGTTPTGPRVWCGGWGLDVAFAIEQPAVWWGGLLQYEMRDSFCKGKGRIFKKRALQSELQNEAERWGVGAWIGAEGKTDGSKEDRWMRDT